MSIIVVFFSFFISQITSTDVMLQLESSDAPGDQMPDQVNLTFNTETKSQTKLNLRRSQYFNLDIPVYSVDTDSEGIMQRHRVETGHRKDIGFYQDIKNKAVFEIQKSPDTLARKKFKFNMKGEFLMNTSKYVFDSQKKTPKKPWRKPTFETFSDSRKTNPSRSATFDPSVYTLELVTTPKFDSFDARVPPPEARKFVKLNSRNRRDKKLNSSGQNSRRPASQSRPRREAVQDYYIDVVALADYKLYSRFLTQANNNMTTAMQDILEHLAFTFNAVSSS
ncbi:ADAM family mig-17 [Biomphalaria glabrata]|nr:ADAM family mig-17-like; partial [Biomphalaria glabrata]